MTTRREFFVMSGMALASTAASVEAEDRPAQESRSLDITQIRNATLRINYAGVRFLVDPMLSERHSWAGIKGTVNSEERNPLVHLPFAVEELIDVDAVIITHLHEDHWDAAAQSALPKALPLFVQNEEDAAIISTQGFSDVRILSKNSEFNGVQLIKIDGQHANDATYEAIGAILGKVCGVVFMHADERTVYLAGDTVWNEHVADALIEYRPGVTILNAGYAKVAGIEDGILMGTNDVARVHKMAPETVIVASHMEAVNHCTLTRAQLRTFARANGFADKLLAPGDGETVTF